MKAHKVTETYRESNPTKIVVRDLLRLHGRSSTHKNTRISVAGTKTQIHTFQAVLLPLFYNNYCQNLTLQQIIGHFIDQFLYSINLLLKLSTVFVTLLKALLFQPLFPTLPRDTKKQITRATDKNYTIVSAVHTAHKGPHQTSH